MTINLADFPNMRDDNCRKTSEPMSGENCVAHACGARGEWWEPIMGRIWTLGPPYYNYRIGALVRVFERCGYVACDSVEHEPEYEKIAIYGRDEVYQHVARQLPDGTWTSKLGPEDDVRHSTLDVLASGAYEDVVMIMRRRRFGRDTVECCEAEDRVAGTSP